METTFAALLAEGDVAKLRRWWRERAPHLPQPRSDAEAAIAMHHARTRARCLPLRLRAWSHRWLGERGLPSGLPDRLRPSAERMYPRDALAVGISLAARSSLLRPLVPIVRDAMADAVLEADADGRLADSAHVSARMAEARETTIRKLMGVTR